jgi:hypothetical protein
VVLPADPVGKLARLPPLDGEAEVPALPILSVMEVLLSEVVPDPVTEPVAENDDNENVSDTVPEVGTVPLPGVPDRDEVPV